PVGRQAARLPDGFVPTDAAAPYAAGVYAISNPLPDTDTFPAAFADPVSPGALLQQPDPGTPDPFHLAQTGIIIAPLQSIIVPIAIRSHGMCKSGSCNERSVRVEGTFSDGKPALGRAGTALLVDDTP